MLLSRFLRLFMDTPPKFEQAGMVMAKLEQDVSSGGTIWRASGGVAAAFSSPATTSSASATGNQAIDGLLSGFRWASTSLTFAMPGTIAAYPDYNVNFDETGTFAPVTASLATTVRNVMSHIAQYTGLTIIETSSASQANIRIGRSSSPETAVAYLPDGSNKGGDVWIGSSTDYDAPVRGDYGWMTILHEIGHALGLKHSHSYTGGTDPDNDDPYDDDVGVSNLPVTAALDSLEYTVMSYRSYANQDLDVFDNYTNETAGYPQSLMMLDIAALQAMYGADFSTNSSNTVYTFSAATGQMSINGVSEGALAGNRIFRTLWDGGGNDTYDLSNYGSNLTINLTPGASSLFSQIQRADLGFGNLASGNLYNALLYQGDMRSLIENATGGAGNDTITGNSAANVLNGNGGNDTLNGGAGADSLDGGAGFDITSYTDATATVQVVMYNTNYNTGEALGDVFTSIEALQGSANIDILVGGFLADSIWGGVGGDWLDGTYGGDSLYGQSGNDSLVSRVQADVLDGGADFDYARYDYADAGLNVFLHNSSQNSGWALGDTLVSIEGIAGSYFADNLQGDAVQNVIFGLGGADYIVGLGGADLLIGGSDADLFHYTSTADGGDVIQDFGYGADRISVSGAGFGLAYLAGGGIESWLFAAGTVATYATSQFIWNAPTGQLWYDQDGTGAGAQVLLATLQAGALMTAGDVLVI
jgi:serralysin